MSSQRSGPIPPSEPTRTGQADSLPLSPSLSLSLPLSPSAVRFTFFPNNHTVTQSSFDSPCTKLESPFNPQVDIGIDSSFNFATSDPAGGPVFAFTVQTAPDVPLWFYCRQTVKVPHARLQRGW